MTTQIKKEITLNGLKVKLNPLPPSKKGAKKLGSRIHVKGLGTVYVLVYETTARPGRPANPTPPRGAELKAPQVSHAEVSDVQAMMVDILRKMNERLDAVEDAVTRPPRETPDAGISPPNLPAPSH
jgi:hypothetical protein